MDIAQASKCRELEQLKLEATEAANKLKEDQMRAVEAQVRKQASTETCAICFESGSSLDGVWCPARDHFVCNGCFDGWVFSESMPADEQVPQDLGNVWCPAKPGPRGKGCTSLRPFNTKVRCK